MENTFCAWAPWSSDLTVGDLSLWGFVKGNVDVPPLLQILQKLKRGLQTLENIRHSANDLDKMGETSEVFCVEYSVVWCRDLDTTAE